MPPNFTSPSQTENPELPFEACVLTCQLRPEPYFVCMVDRGLRLNDEEPGSTPPGLVGYCWG